MSDEWDNYDHYSVFGYDEDRRMMLSCCKITLARAEVLAQRWLDTDERVKTVQITFAKQRVTKERTVSLWMEFKKNESSH